jgi:hypothetical protein
VGEENYEAFGCLLHVSSELEIQNLDVSLLLLLLHGVGRREGSRNDAEFLFLLLACEN